MSATELLLDSNRGKYIPQFFVTNFDIEKFGLTPEDVEGCLDYENENYWECWDRILNKAERTDEHGHVWLLHQDGDLWLVCEELMSREERRNFYYNIDGYYDDEEEDQDEEDQEAA